MPGSSSFNFGAYKFDGSTLLNGIAREDLLEQITNISPYDTPFVSQAPKVACRHIYHQWLNDTLATQDLSGAVEGADWALDSTQAPTRDFNVTMILRKDIGLSESQRSVDTAGFKDQYAYEVQKATKELAIKLEKIVFGVLTSATGAVGTARVMKGLQAFITTNSAFAGSDSAAGVAGPNNDSIVSVKDFNDMLNLIYTEGGNPEQVYVSAKVKRQISAFSIPGTTTSVAGMVKNIAAADKKLIGAIDFYESDFGLIQIVLDRWVPESNNTSTATASATVTGGVMFFLSRAMNRLAWLRPMHHELVGKRGDSVAGLIVGEVTLEVLSQKANGIIKGVNNKSSVT